MYSIFFFFLVSSLLRFISLSLSLSLVVGFHQRITVRFDVWLIVGLKYYICTSKSLEHVELVVSLKDVRGKKWSEWFVVLPHCVHGLICIFCKTRKFLNLISCFMLDSASMILHIYPHFFFSFLEISLLYSFYLYHRNVNVKYNCPRC